MFQDRIKYKGDLSSLFEKVVTDYDIGSYKDSSIKEVGYEDLNCLLETSDGKFFVKIFAAFRSAGDVRRYIKIISEVVKNNILHPRVYQSKQGILSSYELDGTKIDLVIMEHLEEPDMYNGQYELNDEEKISLIQEASKINCLSLKPKFVYDGWAVVNILKEHSDNKEKIEDKDLEKLEPIIQKFKNINFSKLPHCFVHGDIIKTNVIISAGNPYIIDYSVANYYPRIQEIAVLLCNIFFYENDIKKTKTEYNFVVETYNKLNPLTAEEIKLLPLYLAGAHSMHIIGASKEKDSGNDTEENKYWLNQGRKGLEMQSK